MRSRYTFLLMLFSVAGMLPGAGRTEETGSLRIVTTTGIVSDVVEEIAGTSIELYRLIPPGQDPHSYEPSPGDIAKVEKADLVFVNGFDLEEGLLTIIENVHRGKIIEVSSKIDAIRNDHDDQEVEEHGGEDHHHAIDPHTWMSPVNVQLWAEVIVEALSAADSNGASGYRERGGAYINELISLDLNIRKELQNLPQSERILVTDHDVFGYFARDYGFTVAGTLLKGFSTASEPSPRDIADLISLLGRRKIRAVFIGESSGSGIRKLAETVKEESGGSIAVRELLTGSLRPEGQPGDTYTGMMEYNVNAIVSGLTGQ